MSAFDPKRTLRLCEYRLSTQHKFSSGTIGVTYAQRGVPRYYFHLLNDLDAPDEEGKELPDLAAAREQARYNARFTAGEADVSGAYAN